MTVINWLIGFVVASGGLTAILKKYKIGPFLEDMSSYDTDPPHEPFIPASVPPVMTPTTSEPVTPTIPHLDFSTPQKAFHSVRVICDEMGLSYEDKNEICYTIYGESEFHIGAVGKPNKDGTRDWGICQYNDGKIKGVPIWIGEGATFKDTQEVLNNPDKCVQVMIQTYKAGHIRWWYAHKGYSQAAAKASPMWKLAV